MEVIYGRKFKKILSIALTLILCFGMVACSTNGGKSSMGRYVEEKYELPEGVEVQNLSLLENDKIGMIGFLEEDFVPVFFISEYGGKTWTKNDFKLPKEEGKETYFNSIGYLNDETILLSYYFQEPLNENAEGNEELAKEFNYENSKYKYATVDKEGNLKEIDLDFLKKL